MESFNTTPIEIWGGIECTINRVGEKYNDQIIKNGHCTRPGDLELFAGLGIKTLRYPVLWEKIQPQKHMEPDWFWTDERLQKLKSLDIQPIAGLLHHGSGPVYTNLLDPAFPDLFQKFAGKVAERYPWLEYFTPINEPLTTARFSALYGFWYPHEQSDLMFCKALLNQIKAIKLAMAAIRKVIPNAKLVQTEDLGKTKSTKILEYQAHFENERRWLTYDLLCSKVMKGHTMWDYFLWAGITEKELMFIQEEPCPPEIVGINHYLSSERFLDHRLKNYPSHLHGGNGKHAYADIETVRVGATKTAGYKTLLKETCERYALPVVVTEVHLGGTREEQMRWFYEAWTSATQFKEQGYPIKAITAWALLGLFDWDSLLVHERNHYESGIFDVRGAAPRPTALATLVKDLIAGIPAIDPIAKLPGWWKRNERIIIGKSQENNKDFLIDYSLSQLAPPVVITGGSGTLGKAFARICQLRGIPYRLLDRNILDITDTHSIERAIASLQPWAIINTAGYADVDRAELDSVRCYLENTQGPANLAVGCRNHNLRLITFSSDLVFDGKQKKPYMEDHLLAPLSIYGLSKKKAEQMVLQNYPDALIIRTSGFFSPWDNNNFIAKALESVENSRYFQAPADIYISPTYVPDLVNISMDLLIDREKGIWNITNPSEISWVDFAKKSVDIAGGNSRLVSAVASCKMKFVAKRPVYSALGSKRGILLSSLEEALHKNHYERKTFLVHSPILEAV